MRDTWNLMTAARWGAVLGPVGLALRAVLTRDPGYQGAADFVGYVVGGAIGGVLLFVSVAAIRNYFTRP